jgi:hypothetical protein
MVVVVAVVVWEKKGGEERNNSTSLQNAVNINLLILELNAWCYLWQTRI